MNQHDSLIMEELLANLPGMAYRCRNDPQWPMLFISEGVLELTGYSLTDLQPDGTVYYGQLIHPEDQPSVWEEVQKATREARRFELEYRIITNGGEEKWVWERGRAVGYEGNGESFIEGLIIDITGRKGLELQLEYRVRELEALNRLFQAHLEERYRLIHRYREVIVSVSDLLQRDEAIQRSIADLPWPHVDDPVPRERD